MKDAMTEMTKHFGTTSIEVGFCGHSIIGGFIVETVRVGGEYFDVWFSADYSIDHVNRDGG
jgi:hypothetical protein